jgi:cation diffusion facilitator CzcD-associated flavoprotein CzcO
MNTTMMNHCHDDVEQCIIIGSGFGGLCQAIKLKKANIHNFKNSGKRSLPWWNMER